MVCVLTRGEGDMSGIPNERWTTAIISPPSEQRFCLRMTIFFEEKWWSEKRKSIVRNAICVQTAIGLVYSVQKLLFDISFKKRKTAIKS